MDGHMRHKGSRKFLVLLLSFCLLTGLAWLSPAVCRAVPVFDTPTETATGITAGTVTVNTSNNITGSIMAKIQRAMMIMQDINQVISTMEIGYMMFNDIKAMGSGHVNFFSAISDIMNMASMTAALGASTMSTLGNIATNVGPMLGSNGSNPMAFAQSASWNQDIQDLGQFSTMATMASGISNSIQMMSLMNSAGFIGKLQAAQAGINVGLITASAVNQYEMFKLQRAEVRDQRRIQRDTKKRIDAVHNELDKHFTAINTLYHQGCFGNIGMMSTDLSYSPASGACVKFAQPNIQPSPPANSISLSPPSSPSLPMTSSTMGTPVGSPLPGGPPSYSTYGGAQNPSSIAPPATFTPPSSAVPAR